MEPFGLNGQFGHVAIAATGMAGDEIGDELLLQSMLLIDLVENPFELLEQFEGGLAHHLQHVVLRMFRCDFQAAGNVSGNQLLRIGLSCLFQVRILILVQQQVVTDPAADERTLDTGQLIHGFVQFQQGGMVGIQIGTDGWRNARGFLAMGTDRPVFSLHTVHIGRRTAQIAQIAFEAGHLSDLLHFAQDGGLATGSDEFALVG